MEESVIRHMSGRQRLQPVEDALGVGSSMVPTMRPSARNSTSSAYPAATGSWVTITTDWSIVPHGRPQELEHLAAGDRVEVAGGLVREHERPAG